MSGAQVLRAMMTAAGRDAQLIDHAERPWNSATFDGTAHTFRLLWEGLHQVAERGEIFCKRIRAGDFDLPGLLVGEALVLSSKGDGAAEPAFEAEISLLVLEPC